MTKSDSRVNIRIPSSELAQWTADAQSEGLSLTQWIRKHLKNVCTNETDVRTAKPAPVAATLPTPSNVRTEKTPSKTLVRTLFKGDK